MKINILMKNISKIAFFCSLLFTGLILPQKSTAQTIRGTVVDEDKEPLEFVSVAVLQPSDSLLVKYTSTGPNGNFELSEIREGTYLFQIYLMTYQADQRTITMNNGPIDLGTVQLKKEVNQLDEVVVNAVIPIKIMQDTVAFNTKAFKVKQDDNVEDLIKKLPGVQISTDGTVNAQGEDVSKILVDGKEFFNNDPQIALKNLTADAVKSVEIIDEKSDDTRTTGIDDGERNKIINLVLKEGRKSGYFGKDGAGIGTEERYTTNMDINRFTKNTQLALFGSLNNINNTGATVWRRGGGRADNSGFLTTGNAGANYNYEFKKDYNFNIDYHYGYSDREQEERTNRTEFVQNSSFSTESEQSSQNISNNHNVNFSLRDRSVEGRYLVFRGSFKKDDRESDSSNETQYFNNNGEQETSSDRDTRSEDDRSNGNLRMYYNKKLNETGRNLRIEGRIDFIDNKDMNFQESLNMFNMNDPQQAYEREEFTVRDEKYKELNYNLEMRYMEPIVPHHFVSFTTEFDNDNRDEELNQTKTVNGTVVSPFLYDIDYSKNTFDNQLGYVYSKGGFQFYLSAGLQNIKQQLELDGTKVLDNKFDKVLPRTTINYEFKPGSRIRFRYSKSLELPSINQLAPVVNDFNPFFVTTGNMELTPERRDNFNIRGGKHGFRDASSFFIWFNYTKSTNAIVTNRTIDPETYVNNVTYQNFGDKHNFTSSVYVSRKIKKLGMRYNVRVGLNSGNYTTIINDQPNETDSKGSSFGIGLGNDNKNKVDLDVGANFNFTNTSYSAQNQDNDYVRQNYYTKFDIDLTDSFSFNTQFDYTIYSDDNFDSETVPVWNMAVEYAFLKGKRGNLKLQLIDILDKSVGIERSTTANYFEESFKTNLGTYALLSFTYNIKPPTGRSSKRDSGRRGHWRRRD